MEAPAVGHIQTNFVELGWVIPPIGPMASLTEEEGEELLAKTAVAAKWFSIMFNTAITDPTYLPLLNRVMRTAADMMQAEMEERGVDDAEKIRKMLEDNE